MFRDQCNPILDLGTISVNCLARRIDGIASIMAAYGNLTRPDLRAIAGITSTCE